MDQKPDSQVATEITLTEALKESTTKLAAISKGLTQSDAALTKHLDPWAKRITLYASAAVALYGLLTFVIVPHYDTFLLLLFEALPTALMLLSGKLPRAAVSVIGVTFCPVVSIISLCVAGYIFVRLFPTDPHAFLYCVSFLAIAMTWAMLGAHFLLVSFMRTISGVQDVIDKLIESTYQSRNRQLSLTERIIDVISQTAQQRTSAQSSEETPKPPATE